MKISKENWKILGKSFSWIYFWENFWSKFSWINYDFTTKSATQKSFLTFSLLQFQFLDVITTWNKNSSFISILTEPSNFHHFFVIFLFMFLVIKRRKCSQSGMSFIKNLPALINFSSLLPPTPHKNKNAKK